MYPKMETSAVNINETRGNAAILFDEMFDEGIVPKALWSSFIHSFIHSFTLFSVYPYTGENQGCGNCHSCSYKN